MWNSYPRMRSNTVFDFFMYRNSSYLDSGNNNDLYLPINSFSFSGPTAANKGCTSFCWRSLLNTQIAMPSSTVLNPNFLPSYRNLALAAPVAVPKILG